MYKALHPRVDIDRLHVSRKEKVIGLINFQDSVDTLIRSLEDDIKKTKESLITATQTQHKHKQNNNIQKRKKIDISSDKQTKSHRRRHIHGRFYNVLFRGG